MLSRSWTFLFRLISSTYKLIDSLVCHNVYFYLFYLIGLEIRTSSLFKSLYIDLSVEVSITLDKNVGNCFEISEISREYVGNQEWATFKDFNNFIAVELKEIWDYYRTRHVKAASFLLARMHYSEWLLLYFVFNINIVRCALHQSLPFYHLQASDLRSKRSTCT